MAKKPSDTITVDAPADAPLGLETAPPPAAPPADAAPAAAAAAPPPAPADPYSGEVEALSEEGARFLAEIGRGRPARFVEEEQEEPEEDVCALVLAEVKKQTGLTHVGAEVRNLYPAPRGFSVEFAFSKEQQPSMLVFLRLSGEEAERIAHLWRRYLYTCERGE